MLIAAVKFSHYSHLIASVFIRCVVIEKRHPNKGTMCSCYFFHMYMEHHAPIYLSDFHCRNISMARYWEEINSEKGRV